MLVWLVPLIIWEGVWKGIALWKSGRNNQLAWFVCILVHNTAGILPIVYLIWFQKKAPCFSWKPAARLFFWASFFWTISCRYRSSVRFSSPSCEAYSV